jgi:recombination associated protein RdgC
MFFKNILLYRLIESFNYSLEDFNQQLKMKPFFPCPRSEDFSEGWVSPYELDNELYVHSLKGYLLFAFCKEKKLLPGSVIREALNQRIAELTEREQRDIYRKEKKELREQIIMSLRAQAFSQKKVTFAYIDTNENWLIVDTASRTKGEEVCSFLRKTLGSLKLALPTTTSRPEAVMTTWLREKQGLLNFKIENNCDMLDPRQKASMIKCKEQDLSAEEIVRHLHAGKQIVKLALNWEDKVAFELNEDLSIKKIKFLDIIQKQRETIHVDSKQAQLDADFAIMTGEFSKLLSHLWPLFEGLIPVESPTTV